MYQWQVEGVTFAQLFENTVRSCDSVDFTDVEFNTALEAQTHTNIHAQYTLSPHRR